MSETATAPTYESACARIEAIIRRLDSGEAGLRETLELCQEGRTLVEFCAGELEAVGQGLEELRLDELVDPARGRARRRRATVPGDGGSAARAPRGAGRLVGRVDAAARGGGAARALAADRCGAACSPSALLAGAALLVPGIRERSRGRRRARPRGRPAPPRSGAGHRRPRAAPAHRPRRRRPGRRRAGGAPARARKALLAEAHDALQADAARPRRRPGAGPRLRAVPARLRAAPARRGPAVRRAAYQCVAVTSRFGEDGGQEGVIGIPFRLVADFAAGRYAFCRVVPLSDRDRLTHPLPAACRR